MFTINDDLSSTYEVFDSRMPDWWINDVTGETSVVTKMLNFDSFSTDVKIKYYTRILEFIEDLKLFSYVNDNYDDNGKRIELKF